MRAWLEIVRFELRLQARAPLFITLLLVTALLHFLVARKIGIDIGLGAAADASATVLNASIAIVQNQLVLSLLMVFPAVALAATAITRDAEWRTAEQFHVLPIRPAVFLGGRFAGALLLTLCIAVVALLVALSAMLLPGNDPARMGPFRITPWLFALVVVVIPNAFIATALVHAAAANLRALSAAFALAVALASLPIIGQAWQGEGYSPWLAMMDPFGVLSIAQETRYWDGRELSHQLPGGLVYLNRALWIGIAIVVFALTLWRYRFGLAAASSRRRRVDTTLTAARSTSRPRALARLTPTFGRRDTWRQLASQTRMDLRALLRGWIFPILLLVVAGTCAQHFFAPDALLRTSSPLPRTTRLIGFLDMGLALPLTLAVAWFAGLLVHREWQSRLAGITDASPVATPVLVAAKMLAIAVTVALLQLCAVFTFVLLQSGRSDVPIEPLLWLQAVLVYGFNHYALIIPAVLIHLLIGNRWLGTLLFLVATFAVTVLPGFGVENLLVSFRLATLPHSDMNGFGHYAIRSAVQMVYWSGLLVVLAVVANLLAPRGERPDWAARLRHARTRFTPSARAVMMAGIVLLVGAGTFIAWNIYARNEYLTAHISQRRAVDYERQYQPFAGMPQPELAAIDVAIGFEPAQRRVQSRGTITLRNHTLQPIPELLVSVNPLLVIEELAVPGAQIISADRELGVWRLRLGQPLDPGDRSTLRWRATWRNEGFTNTFLSDAVAHNGTLFYGADILPMVGYSYDREIDSAPLRHRLGLPAIQALPDLDDPQARAQRYPSFSPIDFHAVLSTSADQIPVTVGSLQREWEEGGRRHAEYRGQFVPALGFASARYAIARADAGPVKLEIYHDPKHALAVPSLIRTAQRGLNYYSSQFGPYPLDTFRIVEYPRYSTRVRALAGMVAFAERSGFDADFPPDATDMVVAHELGHMWWGGQVRSARLQGQQVLNETLAQYSAVMLIETHDGRDAVRQLLRETRHDYLDSVSRVGEDELPVIRATFGNTAYGKGTLSMYALRQAAGSEAVHRGLRNFLVNHGNRPVPYPTTRELVAELRAACGPAFDALITDLFERSAYQEFGAREGVVRRVADGYEVTLTLEARQYVAAERGVERDVSLTLPLEVEFTPSEAGQQPVLIRRMPTSGRQTFSVLLPWKPASVALDPYALSLDRHPEDDTLAL